MGQGGPDAGGNLPGVCGFDGGLLGSGVMQLETGFRGRRDAARLCVASALVALALATLTRCAAPSGTAPAPGAPEASPATAASLPYQPAVLATSLAAHVLAGGDYARWERAEPPARVLVVAHSFSDRTHLVARETARMLGAPYLRLYEAPGGEEFSRPVPGLPDAVAREGLASFGEVVEALSAPDLEVVFLGSPIWGEPTPLVARTAAAASLAGKLVVPFCTHLQQFEVAKMERYLERLRARGARVAAPWVLRLALNLTGEEIRRLVWRALAARADLWWNREPVAAASCAMTEGETGGLELCRVPAGMAWISTPQPLRQVSSVYEREPLLVRVPAFEMTREEISVAAYGGGRDPQAGPLTKVWNPTCAELVGSRLDLPMPCVSFDEAEAWCEARGMHLSTLAEWTRAARGDRAQPFPWGDGFAFDGRHGNFGEARGNDPLQAGCNMEGVAFRSDGFPGLAPGCSFPDGNSAFGVCDLAGNLGEWVAVDGALGGAGAALAGGAWYDCEPGAWQVDRPAWWPPAITFDGIGFRCARALR